ncbi:MAG: TIGR01777 family protein [Planctomycetota bacterium]|nr:MAG: TIGR01777 family protein [Planctomycetota bacterium]
MNKTVLITGGSGFLGSKVSVLLKEKGFSIICLSRKPADTINNIFHWDPKQGIIDDLSDLNIDIVLHLAGENVGDGLWTKKKVLRLRESRIKGTQLIVDSLRKWEKLPELFLCSSAIGFYGGRGDVELDEQAGKGAGFFSDLCDEWEGIAQSAESDSTRVICLRTGIVLDANDGPLKKMTLPFKFFVGGKVGSGDQYMSWIHIVDWVNALSFCILNENIIGPVNMVSPEPVINSEFTKCLAKVLNRPALFPVPRFILKSLPNKMGQELFLNSAKVIPQKLLKHGFQFKFTTITSSLKNLLIK